jgi:hypothetical protein
MEDFVPSIWILIVVVATAAVAVPLAAVAIVSLASVREESAHSLSGQAPGLLARIARQLLAFQSESAEADWPVSQQALYQPASRSADRHSAPRRRPEVRFAYARRTLSDFGQLPAIRQPQPRAIRYDQRQGAGV